MPRTRVTFVFCAAFEKGVTEQLGLERIVLPVMRRRAVGKKDMILNDRTPQVDVDPDTYQVSVDGKPVACEP